MKKTWIIIFVVLGLFISCSPSKIDKASVKKSIKSILKHQQTAWNNHDIEGFMAEYWQSEELTFQSGDQRLYGWRELLNRYKTNYVGEEMGMLTFSDIQIKVLGSDSGYAIGRWKVKQEETVKSGLFTIILMHLPSGWKIIHDHTS